VIQVGTFKIIGAVLDVRAKLLVICLRSAAYAVLLQAIRSTEAVTLEMAALAMAHTIKAPCGGG
jgi:hypothetical protein